MTHVRLDRNVFHSVSCFLDRECRLKFLDGNIVSLRTFSGWYPRFPTP